MLRTWLQRLGGFIREDRLFFGVFVALTVLYALPLLLVKYPPMQDWAAHLRIVEVWRQAGDVGTLMGSEHGTRSWLQPYTGYHLLLRGLGAVLPLVAAQRVLLVLYTLAVPFSFLYLLLTLNRERRLALLSFPFVYNAPLIYGLFPQALSLPLVIFGVALLKRYLDAPSRARELGITAVTLAIFFFHFSAFISFGLAAAVVFFCHVHRPKQIVRRALFTLPALAMGVVWISSTIENSGFIPRWWSISANLANFHKGLIDILVGSADEVLLLAVVFTTLAVLLLPRRSDDPTPTSRDWSIGAAGLVLIFAVFLLPSSADKPAHIWAPNLRLALPGVMLLLALPRVSLARWRGLLLLPLIGVLVYGGITILGGFLDSGRQAEKIDAVLSKIPANKRVLPVIYHASDGIHHGLPYMHLPELYQVRQGGFVAYGFVGGPAAPVFIKHPTAAPIWFMPLTFNYQLHGRYHYFLAIWPAGPQPPKTFVGAGNNVRLVDFSGRFCLYENIGPLRPK